MKTKFNYNLEDKDKLFNLAIVKLNNKLDLLPDLSDENSKEEDYKKLLKKEIEILQKIKFDGYLLMLSGMVDFTRQQNIFIACYGTVQNSLITYLLDISDNFKQSNFINFLVFEKNPIVNIVASSYRYQEIISYLDMKYSKYIKRIDKASVIFNDSLKICFIDLNIDTETKPQQDDILDLGLDVLEADINTSKNNTALTSDYDLKLGFDSLEIGDVLANRIISERDDENKPFTDIEDLKERVTIIMETDEKSRNILFDNLIKNIDRTNKMQSQMKEFFNYLGKGGSDKNELEKLGNVEYLKGKVN